MPALARLVTALLDALELERADVLGYSWGGGLAQELAHRYPERVRRLVLCATGAGPRRRPAQAARGADAGHAGALLPPEARASWSLPFIAGGRGGATGTCAIGWRRRRASLGYAFQLYAAAGWTSLPWLHTLPHETLVVAGDDDPSVPFTNARILAARIPHARLERDPRRRPPVPARRPRAAPRRRSARSSTCEPITTRGAEFGLRTQ